MNKGNDTPKVVKLGPQLRGTKLIWLYDASARTLLMVAVSRSRVRFSHFIYLHWIFYFGRFKNRSTSTVQKILWILHYFDSVLSDDFSDGVATFSRRCMDNPPSFASSDVKFESIAFGVSSTCLIEDAHPDTIQVRPVIFQIMKSIFKIMIIDLGACFRWISQILSSVVKFFLEDVFKRRSSFAFVLKFLQAYCSLRPWKVMRLSSLRAHRGFHATKDMERRFNGMGDSMNSKMLIIAG